MRGVITIVILPAAVSKLECLRHLLSDGELIGQFRLDKLRHLETLKRVSAKHLIKRDAIQKLTNLRSLAVEFKTTEEVMAVINSPIFWIRPSLFLENASGYSIS